MTRRPTPPPEDSDNSSVGVVIVAAGASRRMITGDKVFEPLLGRPMITHTVSVFEECPEVKEIVLVLGEHNLDKGQSLAAQEGWKKLKHICPGGQRRQDSVKAGLQQLSPCRWIMVHDGARPCVTQELIESALESVLETGAAIPTIAVTDTMKKVQGGLVLETLQREGLWAVQTPQIFAHDLLLNAHDGVQTDVTDDASMVEMIGGKVKVFEGSYENIKVTTPEDLLLAESLLRQRPARASS